MIEECATIFKPSATEKGALSPPIDATATRSGRCASESRAPESILHPTESGKGASASIYGAKLRLDAPWTTLKGSTATLKGSTATSKGSMATLCAVTASTMLVSAVQIVSTASLRSPRRLPQARPMVAL
jgi:hypothetical protein